MAVVSIGLPVHNGAAYLAQTLEALLAQTWEDFEIVISDNASTDATPEISRAFAARERRIRYFRSEKLLMPAENHNRALNLSEGTYFKWAAHDDICLPRFLEACLEVLERDPGVVLCYPEAAIVDENAVLTRNYTYKLATGESDPSRRFGALVCSNHRRHGAFEIYGVIRRPALMGIPPMGNYVRGDSLVLARLALRGRFHEVPEVLFLSRDHGTRSVRTMPDRIQNARSRFHRWIGTGPLPPVEWWDPSRRNRINFPEWRVLREYIESVRAAPLDSAAKLYCFAWIARAMPRYAHKLTRDLIIAAEETVAGRPSPSSETKSKAAGTARA
jgi:glycosyltransferase involved in cell wall biosynthesis